MIRKLCLLSLISCLVSAPGIWNVARAQTTGASGVSQSQRESVVAGTAQQTQKETSFRAQTPAENPKGQRQSLDQKSARPGQFFNEQVQTLGMANEQALWSMGPKEKNARNVSAHAQDLVLTGQWENAHSMLEQAGAGCGEAVTQDAKSCRATLSSASGYLKLQEVLFTAPQSPRAQLLLKSAADSYAEAVRLQPTNGPELSNLSLVYAKLGRMTDAENALQRAAAVDRGRTAVYTTRLGELQVQQKQWDAALDSYQRAAIAAPDSALPARRILDVYRQAYTELSASRKLELGRTLGIWETTAPEIARSGYEFMILRDDMTDSNREQPLLRWAALMARGHELTPDRVKALAEAAARQRVPAEVMAAIRDLSAYLGNPWQVPAANNWWMQGDSRRLVLAGVALAWGQDHQGKAGSQVESGPQVAERCWQTGMRMLPSDLELRAIPGALQLSLDLRLELSTLYGNFPALDRQGSKAKSLVVELFLEKGGAIAAGDLEAEQRYHVVLGLLFAQRRQWTSNDAANAVYQLGHALYVANQRYYTGPSEGFYQPLPELRAVFAEALWNSGSRTDAAQTALEAAMAYIDTDDLDTASRWLETAHEYGAADSGIQQLRSLLNFRRNLVRAGSQPGGTLPAVSRDQQPWLFKMDIPSTEDFLKRQRFKVFADLAVPPPRNQAVWNADPTVQAYKLMLDGKGTPLVGAADLRRWEKVSGILLTSLSAAASPTQLAPPLTFPEGTSAADFAPWHHIPSGDHTLLLTLPGELEPSRIAVSPLAAMAWRVIRALDAPGISAFYQFMQVDANGITIREDAPIDKMEPFLQKLQGGGVAVHIPKSGETA